jgi:hypothetical protein
MIELLIAMLLAAAPDDGYELVRGAAPAVHANAKAAVSLSIVPRGGHRLSSEAPVLVRLEGDGVRPVRAILYREDAVDPRADVPRFELAFTAARAGNARLTAHCIFYLCKAAQCRPVETSMSWDFAIAP